MEVQSGREGGRDWNLKMLCNWSWRWRKGPWDKEWGSLQKQERPRRPTLPYTFWSNTALILTKWDSFWTSGLGNCKIIKVYCYKPLSVVLTLTMREWGRIWRKKRERTAMYEIYFRKSKESGEREPRGNQSLFSKCSRGTWMRIQGEIHLNPYLSLNNPIYSISL